MGNLVILEMIRLGTIFDIILIDFIYYLSIYGANKTNSTKEFRARKDPSHVINDKKNEGERRDEKYTAIYHKSSRF
jgi:hypothetical protein